MDGKTIIIDVYFNKIPFWGVAIIFDLVRFAVKWQNEGEKSANIISTYIHSITVL